MAKFIVCVSIMLVLLVALSESRPFCCSHYHDTPVPLKALKYFTVQEDTGYCNIKAVIFITMNKNLLCANPDKKWVQRAMKSVKNLSK